MPPTRRLPPFAALAAGASLLGVPATASAQASPDPAPGAAPAPAPAPAPAARSVAPSDAYVYIGYPGNNAVVPPHHIKVWFGTRNFGVAPAGVARANTGHHHLLIDAPLPPMDEPIPNDRNHLHFGRGQTEAFIDLPPGRHTLQLLMGDANHVPHDPPVVSRQVTILVRGGP